jgi:hypothetical protein
MFTYRVKLISVFLISMIVYFCSQAQDISSERNSLKAGAWAIQFGITSNFTLTSFQGTTLSMKYQLSDRDAIRGGITINGSTSNGNNSTSESMADTNNAGSGSGTNSADGANVSFVIEYLRYVNPSGPVHFYLGIGPSVSYSYSHSSTYNSNLMNIDPEISEQSTNRSNSHQWGIGVIGVAGVEWFACQWLSIRAEYSDGIQYQWRSTTSTNDNSYTNNYYTNSHIDNSGTTEGWSVSSSGVSFGLSVYW